MKKGKRFMAEWDSYAVCGYHQRAARKRCWAIFDHPTMVENGDDLSYADPYNSGLAISSWEEITITREVEKGVAHRADSIAEVARMAGLDPGSEESVRLQH